MGISEAVERSCKSLGFKAANDQGKNGNPFINFISDVFVNAEYNLTPESYNIIHNMVASGILNSQDLVGAGKLKKANIIFCKEIYGLDPEVIKMYLKKQYALLHTTKLPDPFETAATLAFNVLYKLTTVTKLKDETEAKDLKLNSMEAIEELEAQ
jgi:hypothetical protein